MAQPIAGNIGPHLAKEGLLPPECINVELRMHVDNVMTLHYDVHVLDEDLPKIARAMHAYYQEMTHANDQDRQV